MAAPTKTATYRLSPQGATALLVALFPAKPLGPVMGSRQMQFTFPAADFDITLLDSSGQPTSNPVVQQGIGTWSTSGRQIQFVPDSGLAANPSPASVNYAYVYEHVPSVQATATLTLPAAGYSAGGHQYLEDHRGPHESYYFRCEWRQPERVLDRP